MQSPATFATPYEMKGVKPVLAGWCYECMIYDPTTTSGPCPMDCERRLHKRWTWICPEDFCAQGFFSKAALRLHDHEYVI